MFPHIKCWKRVLSWRGSVRIFAKRKGKGPAMKMVTIYERDFQSAEQLHAYLRHELGFPAYYGGNLAALSDCLEDICHPTRLVVYRDNSVEEPWFDKTCAAMGRVALENDALDVRLIQT